MADREGMTQSPHREPTTDFGADSGFRASHRAASTGVSTKGFNPGERGQYIRFVRPFSTECFLSHPADVEAAQ